MNDRADHPAAAPPSIPRGVIRPDDGPFSRAWQAIEQGRFADAKSLLVTLPELTLKDRVWKNLLAGVLSARRAALSEAEAHLLNATALAAVLDGMEAAQDASIRRLLALTVHHLGWVFRRHDRPDEARRAHHMAWTIRERFGSPEERWDTAVELGLDEELARKPDEARRWWHTAMELSDQDISEPHRRRAAIYDHLSRSLAAEDRFEEAVTAARQAQDAWRSHDAGAVEAARADLRLGAGLLQQAAALNEQGHTSDAVSAAEEALQWLNAAHESLSAFGPAAASDLCWCAEQLAFAIQLDIAPAAAEAEPRPATPR